MAADQERTVDTVQAKMETEAEVALGKALEMVDMVPDKARMHQVR